MVCVKYLLWVCIRYFKGLSKWECSSPSRRFDNKFDVGQGLIHYSRSDFEMVAHLQEVSTSSFLQAILASAAGTCHTWQLPQESLLVVLYCKIEKGFIVVVRK